MAEGSHEVSDDLAAVKRIGRELPTLVRPNLLEEFERRYFRPKAGRALIVGSKLYPTKRKDRRELYRDAVGVDMQDGDGVDHVLNLERELPPTFGTFAHIDCLSVLEHSKRPYRLAANLQRLLEPGGTLFITVPFMWRVHAYPDDYWRFSASGVAALFPRIKWAKLCFAHLELSEEIRVPQVIVDGHIYFARSEVYGFGTLNG